MIGISKCDLKLYLYTDWLEYHKVKYTIFDYNDENSINKFDDCSGLILTGGVDIYPELYNDWESLKDMAEYNYNPVRDGFEFRLIENAIKNKIPVLGICRGCQLINVYFKGSLINDIETIRNVNHKKYGDGKYREHNIKIFKDTLLHSLLSSEESVVNSSHHQSVDRLGEGLIINARSGDGIIEGIEAADKTHTILGVQWHPECLAPDIPASKNLLNIFE